MPPLPSPSLAKGSVAIDGVTVDYRGLSRAEALALNGMAGDYDQAERFILTCSVGWTEEEAEQFRHEQDTLTAGRLIDAILVASGLANSQDADPQVPTSAPS